MSARRSYSQAELTQTHSQTVPIYSQFVQPGDLQPVTLCPPGVPFWEINTMAVLVSAYSTPTGFKLFTSLILWKALLFSKSVSYHILPFFFFPTHAIFFQGQGSEPFLYQFYQSIQLSGFFKGKVIKKPFPHTGALKLIVSLLFRELQQSCRRAKGTDHSRNIQKDTQALQFEESKWGDIFLLGIVTRLQNHWHCSLPN